MILRLTLAGAALLALGPLARAPEERTPALRLDQVQMIGTHNSYHLAPDPAVFDLLRTTGYNAGQYWTGERLARAIDYSREPLSRQLDMGLRAVELDVHDDPAGGGYAVPGVFASLAARGMAGTPYDPDERMRLPGMKVFHQADYDQRSTCLLLADCLGEIAQWSRAHPAHSPILVMLESKAGVPAPLTRDYRPAVPVPFDAQSWVRLKAEIARAFPRDMLLTPADVRADAPTLLAAVERRGWPTLDALKGKVMVLLLDEEKAARAYRAQARLDGVDPIFTAERPAKHASLRLSGDDAWVILPNPADPRIPGALARHMLVYTRADTDTEQARANDPRRRDRAFASGAQLIGTDYPVPDPRFSPYRVAFDRGWYRRCNPVTGRSACR
ncbi:MAG: Ca2+-dependent phosphoinositide-specific phospholipase C [Pseudomonadota bacterium]